MRRQYALCPHQGKTDSSRRIWRVASAGSQYYVVRRQDRRACEQAEDLGLALSLLDRWTHDVSMQADLLQMCSAIGAQLPPRAGAEMVKTCLKRALERGDLLLVRLEVTCLGGSKSEELVEPAAQQGQALRESAKKTWVELRLVDMEGNPVGGKQFLIETPGGGREEGYLDSSGRVRVNGIEGGTCKFMFPDLDRDAWERVPE